MSWFKRHLNWSFFLAWLVANVLVFFGYVSAPTDGRLAAGWITLFVLAAIVVLSAEIWYLLQKRRSLFFLFLNLASWIGFIILLTLENKAITPVSEAKAVETQLSK